jgi:hypothetical protein
MKFYESVAALLRRVNSHFAQINRSGGLTEDDKKRLKELYLEHLVVPRARALLRKYYPADVGTNHSGTPPTEKSEYTS